MENEEISFGRFRLHLGRRELRRDEVLVRLHRRALDILCALAAAKGEVVRKDELMARLWPGRIVEEGNIHVHVSALRKALDEHGGGRKTERRCSAPATCRSLALNELITAARCSLCRS
jgi:DNA-binding winged helix-turn-helix (wHTH) protein